MVKVAVAAAESVYPVLVAYAVIILTVEDRLDGPFLLERKRRKNRCFKI